MGLKRGSLAEGPASAEDIFLHILPGEIVPDIGQDVCYPDNEEEEDPDNPDDEPGDEPGVEGPDVVVPPVPGGLPPEFLPLLPLFFPGHPWSNNTVTATATVPFESPIPAGPTTTLPFGAPIPRQTAVIDFSLDKKPACYNSGLKARRATLIEAIDGLCIRVAEALIEKILRNVDAGFYQIDRPFKVKGQKYTDYLTTFEVMDFCSWKNFDKSECGREF